MANNTKLGKRLGSKEIQMPDGWRMVRFGDVVRNVKAQVDRENTELTRYIAGEHMGSEDIHLRTWGELNGDYLGPAFNRAFRKGQVLYGSRRTYLKKVAVASFDGITSNTTFVLESNDSKVLQPELLPFIMLTDRFTEHSIRESKGSVNPYVNWKDIAKYEFPLPPVSEQSRIAEILHAADMAIQSYESLLSDTFALRVALIDQVIQPSEPAGDEWRKTTVEGLVNDGAIAPPQDGNHGESHPKAANFVEDGIPFLMANNVRNRAVDLNTCKFIEKKLGDTLRIGFAYSGDILLTHKGTVGEVAIVPELKTEYVMLTPQVTYYRVIDEGQIQRDFLFYSLQSSIFQRTLKQWSSQSTRAYVGIKAQRKLPIRVPRLNTQREAVAQVRCVDGQCDAIQANLEYLQRVSKTLCQHLLGDYHVQ